MSLSKKQFEELVKVIKLHIDWAMLALIGTQAITESDLKDLQSWGKLPTDIDVSIIENTFVLGILKSVLKKSEWKDLSFDDMLTEAVRTHSPVEMLAIQQAELNAGQYIKGLLEDISAGVFDALAEAQQTVVTESYIQDIVQDKTKMALLERKSYQKLASDLAHSLEADWSRDWRRVAETELQRAKVQGHAHAIAAKMDVYEDSDGLESSVSVVPAPDACEDCKHHYLDKEGEPKIFKLKALMKAGSNGDTGVSHKRKNGLHVSWKTTLPPLHPRCGCNINYIPPGFGWKDGKLKLVDKSKFQDHLSKARPKLQGRMRMSGMRISIENKKGSTRYWYDPYGKETGSTKMHWDYGYILGTEGTDGDHVDVYIGPNTDSKKVFIVNQMKKIPGSKPGDGKGWDTFDEQKVMLGFDSAVSAKEAYMKQYNDPRFFGSMFSMSMEDFKDKVFKKENRGTKLHKADKAYTPFSPVAKPMGPETATAKPPKPPSLPGLPSPGQSAGPGKPPSGTQLKGASGGMQLEPCPFGGGVECKKRGGDGAEYHKPGYQHPIQIPGDEQVAPDKPPIDPAQVKMQAKQFAKVPHQHSVVMDHLTHGDFGTKDRLGAEGVDTPSSGINEAYKVAIVGNGNALFKPHNHQAPSSDIPRFGVVPHNKEHAHEAAAYKAHVLLGMEDMCPPTTVRQHQGKIGSIQSWSEDAAPLHHEYPVPDEERKKGKDSTWTALAPLIEEHPHLKDQFAKQTAMDIIMNNTDRHLNNFLISTKEDGTKSLVSIDHGLCFGNGLNGVRLVPLKKLSKKGHKLKLDDQTLDHFKKLSFGDFKRAMGEHLEPWQTAQSFLRMKYLVQSHDEDGHIDYDRFVHILDKVDGFGADDPKDFQKQMMTKKKTTHEMFTDFASDFLQKEKASGDPARAVVADEILDTGPFKTLEDITSAGSFKITKDSLRDGDKDPDPHLGTNDQATAPAKSPITVGNPLGSVGIPITEHQKSPEEALASAPTGGYDDGGTVPAKKRTS